MTAEAMTTRINRERLEALKKFIPLRDRVRDKLQQRQQDQMDFSTSTEELFSPITTATKDVKTATERAIWGENPDLERDPTKAPRKETPLLSALENIAAETKETQEKIKELSGEIRTDREFERLADIDDDIIAVQPGEIKEQEEIQKGVAVRKDYSPENVFTSATKNKIRRFDTDYELAEYARKQWDLRDNSLKEGYEGFIKTRDTWASKIYLMKHGGDRISRKRHPNYDSFLNMVKGYQQPPPYTVDPIPEKIDIRAEAGTTKKVTAKGYSGGKFFNNSTAENHLNVTCPGNILSDISRLQVLIGAQRAGHNSPEIINESADICRRLFQGNLINIHLYRELIEELAENHQRQGNSGYYSD